MPVIRGADRAVELRGEALPTLQRLVDRSVGSEAFTVLVNVASAGQAVQAHVHDVEEVLIVVDGEISASLDGVRITAAAGDIVIVPPGTEHTFRHHGQPSVPARVIAVLGSPDARIGPQIAASN
jgi:quercetin dioxygenase-like cupin family protein